MFWMSNVLILHLRAFGCAGLVKDRGLSINNTNGSDRNNKFAAIYQCRVACRQLGGCFGRRLEPPLSPALAGRPEYAAQMSE
jgi:hypothetical protein